MRIFSAVDNSPQLKPFTVLQIRDCVSGSYISMPETIKSLIIKKAPMGDESFIGYVLRLAELNSYDTPSWIVQLAGIGNFLRIGLSYNLNTESGLSRLAQLAGTDVSALTRLLYLPIGLKRKQVQFYLVFNAAIFPYVIRRRTPKICPGCLQDSSYTRKVWDLAPVTACPIHKCLLMDACPNCQSRIGWIRPGVSICRCGVDWREHHASIIEDSEVAVAHQIYNLCGLEAGLPPVKNSDLTSPIYRLDLKDYISALFFVASQYAGTMDTRGKYFVVKRRNSELHEFLCKAQSVFHDWPNNYYSFLDWYRFQQSGREPEQVRSWSRTYNKYKSSLFVQLAQPQFEFLRIEFRKYITIRRHEQLLAVLSVNKDIALSKEDNINNLFISINETKKALELSWKSVKELITAGKLRAFIQPNKNNSTYLLERASVDKFKEELNGAFYLAEAAKALGVTVVRVRVLVKTNMLQPVRGRTIDRTRYWKISRHSVEGLLDALNGKAIKAKASQSDKFLTFEEAVAQLGRLGIGIDILITAIINDEIRPVIRKSNAKFDLSLLTFSTKEFSNFIRDERRLRIGDVLTVSETSSYLRLKARHIEVFIKQGLLQAEIKPQMANLGRVITRECLEQFQATYALGSKLASELQTNSFNLTEILASRGVYPIINKRSRRRSTPLFRKADLEEVDLRVLLAEQRANQQKKYYSEPLNVDRAAEFLQIDPTAVIDLVERGILKVHRQLASIKRAGDDLFFSLYSIKRLAGRTNHFAGLVSASVAATMLGRSISNLNQYYVQTGRLTIVPIKHVRVNLFKKSDIEALIESRNELLNKTVLSTQAATIIGVSASCIYSLIKAGSLKPVTGPSVDGSAINRYLRSDVERLYVEREAFTSRRLLQGMSPRYGRPPGPGRRPVIEVVGPRIEQLLEQWSCQTPDQRLSVAQLHRQLIEENYQIKIGTVYRYVQNRRKEMDKAVL